MDRRTPKMEIIALAFSDLHLNLYSKFNENNQRTLNHFKVLSIIRDLGFKHQCSALFCGDLLHKPETLDQELLELIHQNLYGAITGINLKAISGNHDIKKTSKIGIKPFSWLYLLEKKIQIMDYKSDTLDSYHTDTMVHGVPYVDHNIGLSKYLKELELDPKKKHILLLHTDYPGAKDTDGREVGSVENLNINVLNRFDLVLCGHIHKPQRLSKKVYMVGAPLQQRRTDKDCKLGYWEIYSDLSVKFKELTCFPKFIDVESEEDIREDGNYYTVIPKQKASKNEVTANKISKKLSKKALARKYLRQKGIKDKEKAKLLSNILKSSEND